MDTDREIRRLIELTSIPTAAGREQRVVEWIARWVERHARLSMKSDEAGNLVIERRDAPGPDEHPPLFITAHLDHPAFVVKEVQGPDSVRVEFRGGVLDPYFRDAPITLLPRDAEPVEARLEDAPKAEPFRVGVARIEGDGSALAPGDVGRWKMGEPSVEGEVLHTYACDDLAAVSAAVATMERLLAQDRAKHARLLFTVAEEVGFVGAIGACRLGTMPAGSRVIALENSRSYAESPIGGGPIVRVGDKTSTFSPELTAGVSKLCETIAARDSAFRWQRRLMPGGTCEATAFMTWGYESTCVCLPLGNYHNMADLDRVEQGIQEAVRGARCDRECISTADYFGLIRLLEACATELEGPPPVRTKLEGLYSKFEFVLDESRKGRLAWEH